MIHLLKAGFPLVLNASLGRFDIEDSSLDMMEYSRLQRNLLLLPPLHGGAALGRTDVMQRGLLFQRVNHVYNGYTALDYAVEKNQMESVNFLLNGSFFRESIRNYNPPHQHEPTLFHAVRANPDILRLLLNDSRFDVNERNASGMTLFLHACQQCCKEATETLLCLPQERNIDRFAAVGKLTASYYACCHGHLPIVKLLLKYDCFRCIKTGEPNAMSNMSPIAAVFQAGHRNVVNFILDNNLLSDDDVVKCIKVCLELTSFSAVCIRIALARMKDVPRHAGQLVNLLSMAAKFRLSQSVEILVRTLLNRVSTTGIAQLRMNILKLQTDSDSIARTLGELKWKAIRGSFVKM